MDRVRLLCMVLAIVIFCFVATGAFAEGEWATSGDNIYSTNLGNVGIGNTNPLTELDIFGNVNLNNQYSSSPDYLNPGYYVYKSGTTAYGMKLQYTSGQYGTMIFGPNQADRFIGFGKVGDALEDDDMIEYMRVDLDNGNVGIGTSTPSTHLEILHGTLRVSGGAGLGQDSARFVVDAGPSYGHRLMELRNVNGAMFRVEGSGLATVNGPLWAKEIKVKTIVAANDIKADNSITAREVKVNNAQWSDFVFEDNYQLPSLDHVESYIKENKHLPDVPSAQQIEEDGLSMSEMMAKQMQKIEELTLYVIELKKENESLTTQVAKVSELEARINAIEEK